jgi:putative ABC transport system permease protein
MTYEQLGYGQVAIAALLILVNGAISLALRLNLERQLLLAAARTTGQLLAVGLVLHWVFDLDQWPPVVGLMLLMTLAAGVAAVRRTKHRYPGICLNTFVSVLAGSWLVTAVAVFAVVRAEPWYRPQYAIPLLGMILGNTLNGISLGLDRLGSELDARRDQVEAQLALGATRWEAARGPVREAVRTGMVPILNSMMIVGIVSLPGMMTGQLLSGVDPFEAVKYQIVIMILIAAATAIGTVGVVVLSFFRLFNHAHQFLHQRIESRGE